MVKQRTAYSPYSIGLYVKCAKQYYFEYLDNYTSAYPNKQKIKRIQVEAGKRRELVFGELLHIVLNLFFHLTEEERSEKKLLELLKEVWHGPRGKKGGFPELKDEREWYQEALDILKKFSQTQDPCLAGLRLRGMSPRAQTRASRQVSPTIAYLPEIEKEGEFVDANFFKVPLQTDIILAGKIDRIDKEEDGFHLIDYKTGKSERDDEFQLMVYSILAEGALGKPPTKASYLYLRSGNLKSFQPNKEAKADAKARVLKIAERIKNDKEFSPHPTKLCYYCNYVEFCPAKKEAKKLIAGYKGEDEIAELPF